jgi:hypothetical protein
MFMTIRIVAAAFLIFGALGSTRAANAAPGPTCADAFDDSQVKRDEGKLLEARRLLRVCDGPSCSPTQQKLCSEWLKDVEARVPSVVLVAKDASGSDLVDVKVTMDGVQLATKLDGRAIDVDPGPHAFVFELADGSRAETKAVANERAKGMVVAVTPRAPAAPQPAVAPTAPGHAASPSPATSPGEANTDGRGLVTAMIVVGAVGVAGVALGSVFGFEALSTKSAHCSNGLCDPGYASRAYSQATIATVSLVAGGVLLAGGVTVALVAPKRGAKQGGLRLGVAPVVGFATGGLKLSGTW